jgi:serine/threonine-protein kinase SRPK3
MDSTWTGDPTENNLQGLLEETYFDGDRNEDLTHEGIVKVGALVRRLLRFEPSTRASAQEILQDPWLNDEECSTSVAKEDIFASESEDKSST